MLCETATTVQEPAGSALAVLAMSINDLDAGARKSATDAIDKARRCGEFLVQAKKQVGHGNFVAWLIDNCPTVNQRTARRYMMLARGWEHVSKTDTMSDLTMAMATKLIARGQRKAKECGITLTGKPCSCGERHKALIVSGKWVCRCGGTGETATDDEHLEYQEKLVAAYQPTRDRIAAEIAASTREPPDECCCGDQQERAFADGDWWCEACGAKFDDDDDGSWLNDHVRDFQEKPVVSTKRATIEPLSTAEQARLVELESVIEANLPAAKAVVEAAPEEIGLTPPRLSSWHSIAWDCFVVLRRPEPKKRPVADYQAEMQNRKEAWDELLKMAALLDMVRKREGSR